MPKPAILLIGNLVHARPEWNSCSSFAELKEYQGKTRGEFLEACENGEFDDVMGIYRSNESTALTGPFNSELVNKLPASLKYICHNGAGYDNMDIEACSARGILVSSTPVAVNDATADMALFLMLGALRRIQAPMVAVRAGQWRGSNFQLGHDPRHLTLGILGMGGIGSAIAHRALSFGMSIQYSNRSPLPSSKNPLSHPYVSFQTLLQTSDVISINCSLTKETTHIIGEKEFGIMKKGVVLINTARGKLIDEKALVKALDEGQVWSAGLDVFEDEPAIEEGLIGHPNVVLTPHIGTATVETQKDMELLVLENLESAFKKGVLITQVPEQANPKKNEPSQKLANGERASL